MMAQDIAQHVFVEHGRLKLIRQALAAIIHGKVPGSGTPNSLPLSQKLLRLRFVAQSLARHLDCLVELEEHEAIAAEDFSASPWQLDTSRHKELRAALRRIICRLERIAPTDHAAFAIVSDELLAMLENLDDGGAAA